MLVLDLFSVSTHRACLMPVQREKSVKESSVDGVGPAYIPMSNEIVSASSAPGSFG